MRREYYKMKVFRPEVITKSINGVPMGPVEQVVVAAPFFGSILTMLMPLIFRVEKFPLRIAEELRRRR